VRRILVPLDGSETAEKILQPSLLVGGGESVEITLIRVLGLPIAFVSPEGGVPLEISPDVLKAEREAVESYLGKVAERLAGWNCQVSTAVVEDPEPWSAITGFAAHSGVDLIAMATHGRGGAARMLLGSTAERVIRASTAPVLVVHPQRMPSPWKDIERLAGQVVGMP
jgi:nucleotide-binding universal stress UspA family protein